MAEKPKKDSNRTYEPISISLPPGIRERLDAEAAEDGMNRSEWVVFLIEKKLQEKGFKRKRNTPPRVGPRKRAGGSGSRPGTPEASK
jgi:hypothetical protein